MLNMIKENLVIMEAIKIKMLIECEFINFKKETCMWNFNIRHIPLFRNSDLVNFCNSSVEKSRNEKSVCDLKYQALFSYVLQG